MMILKGNCSSSSAPQLCPLRHQQKREAQGKGFLTWDQDKGPKKRKRITGTYNDLIKQLINKHKVFPQRILTKNTEVILDDTCDPLKKLQDKRRRYIDSRGCDKK